MITQTKLLSHAKIEKKPITADIFLTDFCNNHCPYCTFGRWDNIKKNGYMHYEDFVKYAEKMVSLGVKGFILTGGGEPMLNPDFEKITKWLEDKKIDYGINTNFNVLKYCKPKYLKVSLDAYDEESYFKKRGVRAYKTVVQNMYKYADFILKESRQTKLGIQILATSAREVKRFYKISKKTLPFDYLVVRPMESTLGNYYKNPKAKREAEKIINTVEKLNKKDSRVKKNYKWDFIHDKVSNCSACWSQLAINVKGEVMFCCHKPYEVVGHILDDDILYKKNQFKTDYSKCDIPCRLTAPNNVMQEINHSDEHKNFI